MDKRPEVVDGLREWMKTLFKAYLELALIMVVLVWIQDYKGADTAMFYAFFMVMITLLRIRNRIER